MNVGRLSRRGRATIGAGVVAGAALLAGCGGGGGDGAAAQGTAANPSTPAALQPSSTYAQRCATPRAAGTTDPFTGHAYGDQPGSVATEKSWLRSWTDETYLWYQDVDALDAATLNASNYATAIAYFDALKSPVVTASGKPKDAFHFTYDTPSWVALSETGVAYGYGFNVDLTSATVPRTAVIVEVDPGSAAAAAGLVRGTQIVMVDGIDLVNDATAGGVDVLNAGLFPDLVSSHGFVVIAPGSTVRQTITLTASAVTQIPVRNVQTLPAPNQTVGYLQFDQHIATSEAALIAAVTQLQASGVTDLVLDLRYNGGGYLDIAAELAYMIAGPTSRGKTFEQSTDNGKNPFGWTAAQSITTFHDTALGFSAASGQPLPTLGLSRIYVLATGATCSASEALINGLRGVGVDVVLIGQTTCGKPYGFYPQDNCNTTYFSIQFRGVNALGFGDYADGFAPTCVASDDYTRALGDPGEGMLAAALRYRGTGSCAAAVTGTSTRVRAQAQADGRAPQALLAPPPWRTNRFYRPQ